MRALLLAALLAPSCGCISVEWSRDSRQSPPPTRALDVLVEGRTRLGQTLELMGAPLHVYEYRQTGAALAYGWYAADSKGLRVSVPVYQQASASVDYSDTDEGLYGMLLLFDEQLTLERIRRGWLADLTLGLRRQSPTVLEDLSAGSPEPQKAQEQR